MNCRLLEYLVQWVGDMEDRQPSDDEINNLLSRYGMSTRIQIRIYSTYLVNIDYRGLSDLPTSVPHQLIDELIQMIIKTWDVNNFDDVRKLNRTLESARSHSRILIVNNQFHLMKI